MRTGEDPSIGFGPLAKNFHGGRPSSARIEEEEDGPFLVRIESRRQIEGVGLFGLLPAGDLLDELPAVEFLPLDGTAERDRRREKSGGQKRQGA